jgi:hypothetical protein
LDFGQTIWDKAEVLLGKSWEQFGTWGTPWEQDENTFGNKGKNKNNLSLPFAKQKKN